MERKFDFSIDEYYHVYSRGVERREIFLNNGDRERFMRLLYLSNSMKAIRYTDFKNLSYSQINRGESRTSIGAYCFMPNHFHLLLRETTESGISSFMGKLLTAYSMYFNKKYKRTGSLFEGTFRAEHVDNDNYLKYLFAYIHLNPIKLIEPEWKERGITNKIAAKKYLEKYYHSSYEDHIGVKREEGLILAKDAFPEYFDTPHDFSDFINDWLMYRDDGNSDVYKGSPCKLQGLPL
ncbi:MAG: transposase [Candidatus Paceibacterota bacterium]|jgi:putative transposase